MKKLFNFRVRGYRDRDTACSIVNACGIPEVVCIDMDTAERRPVPLVCAYHHLWQYVVCDELGEAQQMFSGRPMRLCKALISLIKSRINPSHGRISL